MKNEELRIKATEIRYLCAKAFLKAGRGHLGGTYSIADCMAVLFFKYLKMENPKDWFVLSKGHCGPAYYAVLTMMGYISEDDLLTLNEPMTTVPSHPDRNKTRGVDCSTGSLGQGLSQAVGLAYGLKCQNKDGNVYCIIGDGECNEGEIWEALQFASNKLLDNLIIIVDDNKKQVDGVTGEVSCKFDFNKIGELFGFNTKEIDGNNVDELDEALKYANKRNGHTSFIVMNTIKGSGIAYFENSKNCHHVTIHEREKEILLDHLSKWEGEIRLYDN